MGMDMPDKVASDMKQRLAELRDTASTLDEHRRAALAEMRQSMAALRHWVKRWRGSGNSRVRIRSKRAIRARSPWRSATASVCGSSRWRCCSRTATAISRSRRRSR